MRASKLQPTRVCLSAPGIGGDGVVGERSNVGFHSRPFPPFAGAAHPRPAAILARSSDHPSPLLFIFFLGRNYFPLHCVCTYQRGRVRVWVAPASLPRRHAGVCVCGWRLRHCHAASRVGACVGYPCVPAAPLRMELATAMVMESCGGTAAVAAKMEVEDV